MKDSTRQTLPAKREAKLVEKHAFLTAPGLPREAVDLIRQLLAATDDESLVALARSVTQGSSFSLAADVEEPDVAFLKALPSYPFFHQKRELPNPIEYAQLDPLSVGEWFKPDGEFHRAMPGYEYRAEQYEMSSAVAEAFSSQRHLVVEAGTGTGKTMAYLVPAVLWSLANKVPVVISTNTKNLQEQIYHKDLPVISRIIRTPFKSAIIKGRSNYICLQRLSYLLEHREIEVEREQLLPLAQVCAWLFRTETGDLGELQHGSGLVEKLASSAEECRGRKCPHYKRCLMQWARNRSVNADIVITNHSVYFSEPDDSVLALPKNAQVIFDEAHNLEEAATRKFLREVTPYSFRNLLRKLRQASRTKESGFVFKLKKSLLENNFLVDAQARDTMFDILSDVSNHVEAVRSSANDFLSAVANIPRPGENSMRIRREFTQSRIWLGLTPQLNAILDDLEALAVDMEKVSDVFTPPADGVGAHAGAARKPTVTELANLAELSREDPLLPDVVAEFGREADMLVETIHGLQSDMEFLTSVDDANWVYWLSSDRDRTSQRMAGGIHAAPIEISNYLADSLFKKKESVILCSATMNVSGSPKFISHRIGLDLVEPERVMSLCVGSPFDFKRQCLAAVPQFLPDVAGSGDEAEDAYTAAFADFTARLACLTKGRMLVLFTSYRMMQECARLMTPVLKKAKVRLLMQGAGESRERITAMFREDRPSVLFGTDSFWEGVDLIGEALSCLVIARLPFDAVNDPIVSARSERVAEQGASSFHDFALPNAIIKFRQGFGRLIRHNDDRGIVVVADQRIVTKNYGASFRKNMPADLLRYDDEEALLSAVCVFLGSGVAKLEAR